MLVYIFDLVLTHIWFVDILDSYLLVIINALIFLFNGRKVYFLIFFMWLVWNKFNFLYVWKIKKFYWLTSVSIFFLIFKLILNSVDISSQIKSSIKWKIFLRIFQLEMQVIYGYQVMTLKRRCWVSRYIYLQL